MVSKFWQSFSNLFVTTLWKLAPTKKKKINKNLLPAGHQNIVVPKNFLLPSLTYSQIGLIQLVNHLKCGDVTKLETNHALDIPATKRLNWTAFRWDNHLSDLSLTWTKRNVPIKFGHQIGVQKSFASWPNNFQPAHAYSFTQVLQTDGKRIWRPSPLFKSVSSKAHLQDLSQLLLCI